MGEADWVANLRHKLSTKGARGAGGGDQVKINQSAPIKANHDPNSLLHRLFIS